MENKQNKVLSRQIPRGIDLINSVLSQVMFLQDIAFDKSPTGNMTPKTSLTIVAIWIGCHFDRVSVDLVAIFC